MFETYGRLVFKSWALPVWLSRKIEGKIKIEKWIWKKEFERLWSQRERKIREMSVIFGKEFGNFNVTAKRLRRQAEFWKADEMEGMENCSSGLTQNEEPC